MLHVLDPRDRPRVRLPLAALGTALLGAFAWTELADLVLARGLGVPPGTVDADLMSRAIVTSLFIVPSLVAGAFGGAAVYTVRRQNHIGAALLALLVSLASTLALMAGLRYVSSEARALPHHPGRGPWSFVADAEQVFGLRTGNGRPLPPQDRVVVGHVGERAVLVPCGGGQPVVVPAGDLTFSPLTPEEWKACIR